MARMKLVHDRFTNKYIVYRFWQFLWIKRWKKVFWDYDQTRAEKYFNRYVVLADKNSEDEGYIPSKT